MWQDLEKKKRLYVEKKKKKSVTVNRTLVFDIKGS